MEEQTKKPSAEKIAKEIKRRTRRKFTTEEKIKIVLEALRGEDTIGNRILQIIRDRNEAEKHSGLRH